MCYKSDDTNIEKLYGWAPLMADTPLASSKVVSTRFKKEKKKKKHIWHMTCDMWHIGGGENSLKM